MLEGACYLAPAAEKGGNTHAAGRPTGMEDWHLVVLGIDLDALADLEIDRAVRDRNDSGVLLAAACYAWQSSGVAVPVDSWLHTD